MGNKGALIKNERTKLYRKKSTIVLIIAAVVAIAGLLAIPIFEDYNRFEGDVFTEKPDYKKLYQKAIGNIKTEVDSFQKTYEEKDVQTYYQILSSNNKIRSGLAVLEYMYDQDISPSNWKIDLIAVYFSLKFKSENDFFPNYPGPVQYDFQTREEVEKHFILTAEEEREVAIVGKLLENDNWQDYLKAEIKLLNEHKNINVEAGDEAIKKEFYEMYLEMDIEPHPLASISKLTGSFYDYFYQTNNWKSVEIAEIAAGKRAIIRRFPSYNTNSFSISELGGFVDRDELHMTHTLEKQTRLNIDASFLRLKKNAKPYAQMSVPGMLNSYIHTIMTLVTLFGIFLGGSIFASEFSSGTIKLLLISPYKRQRIFWAKVRCTLEAVIGLTILLMIITALIGGVYSGFKDIDSVTVTGFFGKAVAMPSMVAVLIVTLKGLVPAVLYMFFALMLSASSRKSAGSLALPMMVYILGGALLQQLIRGFTNSAGAPMVFSKYLFTSLTSISNHTFLGISYLSAFIVMAITTACFAFVGRDSFCRRDVK